jgi:hypothetical protein
MFLSIKSNNMKCKCLTLLFIKAYLNPALKSLTQTTNQLYILGLHMGYASVQSSVALGLAPTSAGKEPIRKILEVRDNSEVYTKIVSLRRTYQNSLW